MAISIVRSSPAYTPDYQLKAANVAMEIDSSRSPFRHKTIPNLVPPGGLYNSVLGAGRFETGFPQDDPLALNYAEIAAKMVSMATTYPDIVYEDIGDSHGGDDIHTWRVFDDDGTRPIIMVDISPHGPEMLTHTACFDVIQLMIEGNTVGDPVLPFVKDRFAIYVIGTHNPDGLIVADNDPDNRSGRNNANDVNLNRQWPNYFDRVQDDDKGASAKSEVEIIAIDSWITTNNRFERVIFYVQVHAWTSRPRWGYLTEWQIHNPRNIRTIRSTYRHANRLMQARDVSAYTRNRKQKFINHVPTLKRNTTMTGDESGATALITDVEFQGLSTTIGWVYHKLGNGVSFQDGEGFTTPDGSADISGDVETPVPALVKFNSKMKPYLAEYIWNKTNQNAACCLVEYPETEGDLGFLNQIMMDFMHGCFAGACEALNYEEKAVLCTPQYQQPLRPNTNMATFHSIENRPNWHRINGIDITHFPTGVSGDTRPFANMLRTDTSAWPAQKSRSGFVNIVKCTLAYDAQTANFTNGKTLTGSTSGSKAYILSHTDTGSAGVLTLIKINGGASRKCFEDNETITDTSGGSATANGVLTADSDNVFFIYGGRSSAGSLSSGHKENHSTLKINAASALPGNRQHGAMAYDGTYIYFVCGHDGTNYHPEIYRATVSDEAAVPVTGGGWTLWHTITSKSADAGITYEWDEGVQRHTAEVWHDTTSGDSFLLVIGGRTNTDIYMDRILSIDLSSKAEAELGVTLSEKRGYHKSLLVNDRDELYLFGGWNGSSTSGDIERVDLQTPATANANVDMVGTRRRFALAVDFEDMYAYICFGEEDSSDFDQRDTIWRIDFATSGSEARSTMSYELDGDEDDELGFIEIEKPNLVDSASYVQQHDFTSSENNTVVVTTGQDENSTLDYDTQTAEFTVGAKLTGGTSNSTGIIKTVSDSGDTGTLVLKTLGDGTGNNDFTNNETITDDDPDVGGSALANGTLTYAGDFRDQAYEFDPSSLTLFLRETNNARWGYIKGSVKISGSTGDQFTVVLTCRSRMAQSDTRVPYMRIAIITNPLSAWEQIHRLSYTVPVRTTDPHDSNKSIFWTWSYPFVLQASTSPLVDVDETEFRIYARIYGDTTDYDLAFLQPVAGKFCPHPLPMTADLDYTSRTAAFNVGATLSQATTLAKATIDSISDNGDGTGTLTLSDLTMTSGTNRIFENIATLIADDGGSPGSATINSLAIAKQADVLTEIFSTPVTSFGSNDVIVDIGFQPMMGSQMKVTETLFTFTLGTADLTKLVIRYESRENFNTDISITPSLFEQPAEGEIVVDYTDDTGNQVVKVFEDGELNHLRVTRTVLWDMIHLRLIAEGGNVTLYLWDFGDIYSVTFSGTADITGYTANGSGCAYTQSDITVSPHSGASLTPSSQWLRIQDSP